ncbi:MAG TPA: VTT domain-containing protein [Desulfitobacteriaceae bacterium]|nr:VTT domain-containing protein [Desulfitobacteriaceae bacterium]
MILTNKKFNSLLTLLFSLALIIFLYPKLQDPASLQTYLTGLGWKGMILDLVIVALQMLFPLVPFPLLAGLNSVLFGWIPGFLLSLIGSLLGCSLGFWLARYLGQEWIQTKLTKSYILGHLATFSPKKSFFLIILARLTPICPAAVVNYIAGLSPMKFQTFLLASLLGKIPMIAWESWVGHYFWQISDHPQNFAFALIMGILVFGGIWLAYHLSGKKQKQKETQKV